MIVLDNKVDFWQRMRKRKLEEEMNKTIMSVKLK